MSSNALSAVDTSEFCTPEVHRKGELTHHGMAVDIFAAEVEILHTLGIELSYKSYHSENDLDRRLGSDIESAIGLAESPEKSVALRTAQSESAFEPKERLTIAECFGLSWFEQSQRERGSKHGSPDEVAPSQETDRSLRSRYRNIEESRNYQSFKKLRNLKCTTRRKGLRHDKPDHKNPIYAKYLARYHLNDIISWEQEEGEG